MHMLKKIGFYIVAKFVPLLVIMLTTYFFSRWLTPSQYGQYSLVISIASGLSIIAFQWINVTLGRLIPKSSADVKIKIINSGLILYFISSILVLFLCFIFGEFIEDNFKTSSYLIALLAVALGGFELSQRIFNSEERVLAFGIFQGIRGVVFFSFALCFYYTEYIYPGVVYALI
ncbi:lipopolysaccharide biosynthesis protein, partial [Vibrio agarivorans]